MKEMHRLLKRQMVKAFGRSEITEDIQNELKSFLDSVNDAYCDFEADMRLMERSIDMSSMEYTESINKINMLQAQLIHQEKMAGIGQLSAGIAHEINNPLGYILSNMETMKKYLSKLKKLYDLQNSILDNIASYSQEEYKDSCLELLEYIKQNKIAFIYSDLEDLINESFTGLSKIEKIVKSLLRFSRKGNASDFVEYDINKGIRDTLTIANNEIKYYAKVIQNLEQVPSIRAIDGEINQVLLNIIVNAAHAIKEKGGDGTITIHTYEKGDSVCCEIIDDGIGISEANLKRIFEPFFTTKPVGTGTGLGLSIVHDIVTNKHSGSISVKSTVGKGTTFTITLPISNNNL